MNLSEKILACQACDLRKGCFNPIPPKTSWNNIELMIISEQPTKEEDKITEPYYDREHKNLRNLVSRLFRLEDVHFTYLSKCSTDKSPLVMRDVIICKNMFLHNEIELAKPKAILTMGRSVYDIMYKKPKIRELMNGYIGEIEGIHRFHFDAPQRLLLGGIRAENAFMSTIKKIKEKNV